MTPAVRLSVGAAVVLFVLLGWAAAEVPGALGGLALGLGLGLAPWRGQPCWRWLTHALRRGRPLPLSAAITVVNDRSGGGIRYQDGVAAAAIRILGAYGQPTLVAGSSAPETADSLDVSSLYPALHQSLGLTLESLSVLSFGSRRRASGDFPKVYDTLVGNVPYAGRRETWLVLRLEAATNEDGLQCRATVGSATLAAAQRIAAMLTSVGIRARIASSAEITELDERLGRGALDPGNRQWHTLRNGPGWMTTYAYRTGDIRCDRIALAWTMRSDHVIQNITVFPDRSCCATVTVSTPQPPTSSPSVSLTTLPGEQAVAAAANFCAPRPAAVGVTRVPLPASLRIPIGPSGVLLGTTPSGERMMLPLDDPVEQSRIVVDAEDAIVKRLIVRLVATGHRIGIHSRDSSRWESLRMPNISITDQAHPIDGCTLSVVDGTVVLSKQPHTVMVLGIADGEPAPSSARITQTGPTGLAVELAGQTYDVTFDFFRAENRYVHDAPPFEAATELASAQ